MATDPNLIDEKLLDQDERTTIVETDVLAGQKSDGTWIYYKLSTLKTWINGLITTAITAFKAANNTFTGVTTFTDNVAVIDPIADQAPETKGRVDIVRTSVSNAQNTADTAEENAQQALSDAYSANQNAATAEANAQQALNDSALNESAITRLSSPELGTKYSSAGYYLFTTGLIAPTFNFHTPLYKVTEGQEIDYKLKGASALAVIAAFDEDGNYIQANSLQGDGNEQTGIWTSLTGTAYVAFSGTNNTDWVVATYKGDIKDNTISAEKLIDSSLAPSKLNSSLNNRIFALMDSSQIGIRYSGAGYYRYSDGNQIADFQNRTPLFKVAPNQIVDYVLSNIAGVASIAAYDNNGNYVQDNSLEGTGSDQSGTWIAGNSTSFVGFCTKNSFSWSIIPFYSTIADDSITTNKIADDSITEAKILNSSVTGQKVAEKTLAISKLIDSIIGKNKFNLDAPDVRRGEYINVSGSYVTFASFSTTGLMPILAGQTIICNTARIGASWGHNLYNSVGTLLSTVINDNKVTASEDGFCEFTLDIADVEPLNTTQAELGLLITDYEAYQVGISEDNIIDNTPSIDELALPDEIVVCQDTELNIYANTLRQLSDEEELNSIIWIDKEGTESAKGVFRNNNRYQFAVADADEIGTTHTVRVSQKTIKGTTYDYKDCTVRVVPNNIKLNNRTTLNISAAGDSISERGQYELELLYKFADAALAGGSNIRYFGARANGAAGHPNPDSYPLPLYTECRGGWKTEDFLTATSDYLSAANPYWNPNKVGGAGVDIAQYVTWANTGTHPEYPSMDYSSDPIDQIDIHFIMLGTNDTGTKTPAQLLASLNEMADNMWDAYPDCVIVFVTLPPRGLNSVYKATSAEYNQYLLDNFVQRDTGTGRSYLLPIHTWVDREMGYGRTDISRLTDGVTTYADSPDITGDLHPWLIGHMQMADAIFCGLQDIFEKHNTFLGV